MEIRASQEGGTARMSLSGKIDEYGSEELKRRFYELQPATVSELVLDFKGVTYIGSACIGKLLLFYKEMFDVDGKIRIINASPSVYEMLKVVKLDSIMSVSAA